MLHRFATIAVLFLVSACTQQSSSLPSTGAPTPESTALAQGTCPGATFLTTAPPAHQTVWYRC
jgi:hypothetical protein